MMSQKIKEIRSLKGDGITSVFWKCGRPLSWDFTCPDTFPVSHVALASVDPGAVAADAEARKVSNYHSLQSTTSFTPVAVEPAGPLGPSDLDLIHNIGRKSRQKSGNLASIFHLLQHVSVAIQRGNADSVLGATFEPLFH